MRLISFLVITLILPLIGFSQEVRHFTMEDIETPSKDRAFYYQKRKIPKKKKAKNGLIIEKEYYVFNDQLKKEAQYLTIEPTLLTGEYREYYITGQIKSNGEYDKGNRIEGFETFHFNGQLASKIYANEEGKLTVTERNNEGVIIDEYPFFDYQVYTNVEDPPRFLGGNPEFSRFLGFNLKYPFKAASTNVQGKVFVQFIVNHNGDLSEIQVIKGIGSGCDKEAVRVIQLTSKMWTPGRKGEKIVKTRMVIPITFKLEK